MVFCAVLSLLTLREPDDPDMDSGGRHAKGINRYVGAIDLDVIDVPDRPCDSRGKRQSRVEVHVDSPTKGETGATQLRLSTAINPHSLLALRARLERTGRRSSLAQKVHS